MKFTQQPKQISNFISQLYVLGCRRSLIACEWDDTMWRDELTGKSKKNVNRLEHSHDRDCMGNRVGFISHPFFPGGI